VRDVEAVEDDVGVWGEAGEMALDDVESDVVPDDEM